MRCSSDLVSWTIIIYVNDITTTSPDKPPSPLTFIAYNSTYLTTVKYNALRVQVILTLYFHWFSSKKLSFNVSKTNKVHGFPCATYS